jgi:hypothetical protein
MMNLQKQRKTEDKHMISIPQEILKETAKYLSEGRTLRMEGSVQKAFEAEQHGEHLIHLYSAADDLLSAWEGSMGEDPLELAEWQAHLLPKLYPCDTYGHPKIYLNEDEEILCADCANALRHTVHSKFPEGESFVEGSPRECENCGAEIESAYGEPDTEEEEEG